MGNGDIAPQLLQINAIKLSPQDPFTWASGMRSPIYCDNRIALSNPKVRKNILSKFLALINNNINITLVAGVATAGIPWGMLVAHELDLPFAYIRSKPKGHGRQNLIEGTITNQDRVLVVEDLISTGGSSLKAVEAVRETGAQVLEVLAIFEYEFPKAKDNFASASCSYRTILNYTELLDAAKQLQYISEEEENTLSSWKHDPAAWAERLNYQ